MGTSVSCEHRYHRKSFDKPGIRSPFGIWLGMRNSNMWWTLGSFEQCFLGVFYQDDLGLVLSTTSSKKDIIGWVLKEIGTTGGVMNQRIAGAASELSLKKKEKSCAGLIYKTVESFEMIRYPFSSPTTTWNRANPLTKSFSEASVSHSFILYLIALAYVAPPFCVPISD